MVVGGEDAAALHAGDEIGEDGVGDGHAVEGGGPAAQLVDDGQTSIRPVAENALGLLHLNEEGALALLQPVRGTDSREDAVHYLAPVALGGHEETRLRQHHHYACRTQQRRFAAHVGTRQQHYFAVEVDVVGDDVGSVQAGVFGLDDGEAAGEEARTGAGGLVGVGAEGDEAVEFCEHGQKLLPGPLVLAELLEEVAHEQAHLLLDLVLHVLDVGHALPRLLGHVPAVP